ncbi:MAG TPA: serine hydrolase [Lentisphaeria bacterium]|nr:MAG: hypothetical protein A2X47_00625 [Lentisphaerae bacterium GWF2_38_69]HBM16850.1 serine hydrolase [Lentisphaeria bacterium]
MNCRNKTLFSIIKEHINKGNLVGTSVLIARHGEIIFEAHEGFADREIRTAVNSNTIFRLASMTKPIVLAAALAAVERKQLRLDDNIRIYLPNFAPKLSDGTEANITVWQLLTHTAGLTYSFNTPDNEPYSSYGISDGMDESVLSIEENLKRIAKVPLIYKPSTSWGYSLATDVFGYLLEKACNLPLPEIVSKYVTNLLGMKDTLFFVDREKSLRLSKPYADNGNQPRPMKARDSVRLEGYGLIHYSPNRITNPNAYPSGGAGMAGTAKDYIVFLEAIRNGNSPIVNNESLNLMTSDAVSQLKEISAGPGLGFSAGFSIVRNPNAAATPLSSGTLKWGGVYGNQFFIDPVKGISSVILTNTALGGWKLAEEITKSLYSNI